MSRIPKLKISSAVTRSAKLHLSMVEEVAVKEWLEGNGIEPTPEAVDYAVGRLRTIIQRI